MQYFFKSNLVAFYVIVNGTKKSPPEFQEEIKAILIIQQLLQQQLR